MERNGYTLFVGLVSNISHREQLPVALLLPKQAAKNTLIWLNEAGKSGLFEDSSLFAASALRPEIQKLVDAGTTVIGADLLFQGEFLQDGRPVERTRRVKNPREAAAYTFGYNRSLFAERVHDVLTLITFARHRDDVPGQIDLVALDGTGPIAAVARALTGHEVNRAAVNTGGFRFAGVRDIHDVRFLPGGAKYGDLPGFLALAAPGKLWVAGEGEQALQLVQDMYRRAGAAERLTISRQGGDELRQGLLEWLLASE
jgi:hypothetical protein